MKEISGSMGQGCQHSQLSPSNSHYGSIAVIPAWMPESSATDGKLVG